MTIVYFVGLYLLIVVLTDIGIQAKFKDVPVGLGLFWPFLIAGGILWEILWIFDTGIPICFGWVADSYERLIKNAAKKVKK